MSITATYVSATSFTVTDDQTAIFTADRLVKLDCGSDGFKYGTILSSTYSTLTTVVISESVITSNLASVLVGIVQSGPTGSLPKHSHNSSVGQGGSLSAYETTFENLNSAGDVGEGAAQVSQGNHNHVNTGANRKVYNSVGFVGGLSDSVILWDEDGSLGGQGTPRTFYIWGTFDFVSGSSVFSKSTVEGTAEYVQIPDTTGAYAIYYDANGDLQYQSGGLYGGDAAYEVCGISFIIWYGSDISLSYSLIVQDLRYGVDIPWAMQKFIRNNLSLQWYTGLGFDGFTIGDGSLDTHVQFSVVDGSFNDVGVTRSISDGDGSIVAVENGVLYQDLDPLLYAPIVYRSGADPIYLLKAVSQYPLIYNDGVIWSSTYPPYNQYTGGAWQLTQVSANKYVCYHLFATSDMQHPIYLLVGTHEYNSVELAEVGAISETNDLFEESYSGQEFRRDILPIGSVIFQVGNYTNTPKARIVQITDGSNYIDWRRHLYDIG